MNKYVEYYYNLINIFLPGKYLCDNSVFHNLKGKMSKISSDNCDKELYVWLGNILISLFYLQVCDMFEYGHTCAMARVQRVEHSSWNCFCPLLGLRCLTSGICGKCFSGELSCQHRLGNILIDSWGRKYDRKVHYFHTRRTQGKWEQQSVWDVMVSLWRLEF